MRCIPLKKAYEAPEITIIVFETADVITTSGGKDENIGEWDF